MIILTPPFIRYFRVDTKTESNTFFNRNSCLLNIVIFGSSFSRNGYFTTVTLIYSNLPMQFFTINLSLQCSYRLSYKVSYPTIEKLFPLLFSCIFMKRKQELLIDVHIILIDIYKTIRNNICSLTCNNLFGIQDRKPFIDWEIFFRNSQNNKIVFFFMSKYTQRTYTKTLWDHSKSTQLKKRPLHTTRYSPSLLRNVSWEDPPSPTKMDHQLYDKCLAGISYKASIKTKLL